MPFNGERLRAARLQKALSQSEVAHTLGTTYQQVSRWESGRVQPSPDTIGRMAEALDCTVDWLLERSAEPNANAPERQLTPKEQHLLELYRRGDIPTLITDLVAELARANTKEDFVTDSGQQSGIALEDS